MERSDVVVVGAGLAGTAAALAAAEGGARVVLLEWQPEPGGFLLPALSSLPCLADAARAVREARRRLTAEGLDLRCGHTAVALLPDYPELGRHTVTVRAESGGYDLTAPCVVVASGAFEIPREHLAIPGSRPAGVVTAHLAHRLLAGGLLPGRRAVVYGRGPYARDTANRLAGAGMEVAALVNPDAAEDVVEVAGFARVEAVAVAASGRRQWVACDTLVMAVGLIPNTLWLKGSGLQLDRATGTFASGVGPWGETGIPGIFAAGTCVFPDLLHRDSPAAGLRAGAASLRRLREGVNA